MLSKWTRKTRRQPSAPPVTPVAEQNDRVGIMKSGYGFFFFYVCIICPREKRVNGIFMLSAQLKRGV
ncbi:hypothetical protein Hanom_Chr02g00130881 [Helianthus anomalus]